MWDLDKCEKIWTAKPVSHFIIFEHIFLEKNDYSLYFLKYFLVPSIYFLLILSLQPPKNSLGIFTPTWFTSAAFLSIDDHRKFVAGTNDHQVISFIIVDNLI